ncbi:hypothetical protein [Flavobacterium sp.]|uniref:hypothetical protein n=1 Tax=Flavobacterium sp. TaxID=239 RepID=UPI002B4B2CCF|nr:hypothetical protein [Flavobacterium sp.]HLF50895.1 hypothetical protein [Flavobacterium sp.]
MMKVSLLADKDEIGFKIIKKRQEIIQSKTSFNIGTLSKIESFQFDIIFGLSFVL